MRTKKRVNPKQRAHLQLARTKKAMYHQYREKGERNKTLGVNYPTLKQIKSNISQIKRQGTRLLRREKSRMILIYYYNELYRQRKKYMKKNIYLLPGDVVRMIVWSMLKRHIADKYRKQTKLSDLKKRITNSFQRIHKSPMKVDNIINHVIKLEQHFYLTMKEEHPDLVDFVGKNTQKP